MTKEALMLSAVVVALHAAAMIDWSENEGGVPEGDRNLRVEGAMCVVAEALQWAAYSGDMPECKEMVEKLAAVMYVGGDEPPNPLRGGDIVDWAYENLLPGLRNLCRAYGFEMERYGQVGASLKVKVL